MKYIGDCIWENSITLVFNFLCLQGQETEGVKSIDHTNKRKCSLKQHLCHLLKVFVWEVCRWYWLQFHQQLRVKCPGRGKSRRDIILQCPQPSPGAQAVRGRQPLTIRKPPSRQAVPQEEGSPKRPTRKWPGDQQRSSQPRSEPQLQGE